MNALYLIRQDDGQIALDDFVAIVGNLPGTKNLRTRNVFRASAELNYIYEDDQTIVRLDDDLKVIEVTGIGKASVHTVYEIQKRYAHPLRLFDMDYTFDIPVVGIKDIKELMEKMGDLYSE